MYATPFCLASLKLSFVSFVKEGEGIYQHAVELDRRPSAAFVEARGKDSWLWSAHELMISKRAPKLHPPSPCHAVV